MWILNKRKFRAAGLAAASATLVVVPPTSAGATAASSVWQAYPVPVSGQAVLDAVVAPTADDAWAGGFTLGTNGFSPLMLHWNGSGWTPVSVPDTTRIDQLSSTGAGDVWAMTDDQPLRWNGSAWVAVPLVTVPGMNLGGTVQLEDVAATMVARPPRFASARLNNWPSTCRAISLKARVGPWNNSSR